MKRHLRLLAGPGLIIGMLLAAATGAQAASPPAATISIVYDGLQGDLVGSLDPSDNPSWNQPDGHNDGEFTVTIRHGRGLTLSNLALNASGGGVWDTVYQNGTWGLGVTDLRSSALLNHADSTISIPVTRGRMTLQLHADDDDFSFTSTRLFTVTATFSDSSVLTGSVALP